VEQPVHVDAVHAGPHGRGEFFRRDDVQPIRLLRRPIIVM
jgi:hypothetical protein